MALNLPKKPKQSFWDKVRDVADANSPMDQYKRSQAGQPLDYATQQRAMGNQRPSQNIGQAFLGNTARAANTAFNLSYDTLPRLGAGLVLKGMNRTGLLDNGRYNTAVNSVLSDKNVYGKYGQTGGLFNAGTVIDSPTQAKNLNTGDVVKKSVGYGMGTYGELSPVKAPGGVLGRTLMGAGEATIGDIGSQIANNGRVNWKQAAQSAAFGGVAPNVLPVVSTVFKTGAPVVERAGSKVVTALDPAGDLVSQRKLVQAAFDKETNPKLRSQINQHLADLNAQIRDARSLNQVGAVGKDVKKFAEEQKLKALGYDSNKQPPQKPTVTSNKPTVTQVSSIAQGRAVEAPKQRTTSLNVDRLNVDQAAKDAIKAESTMPIDTLSNAEVKKLAESAKPNMKFKSKEQTAKLAAKELATRQAVVEHEQAHAAAVASGDVASAERAILERAKAAKASTSQGTEAARLLQARKIAADATKTPTSRIFEMMDTAGVDPKVYAKRFATVDMNNEAEVVRAYRDLVPAKFSEWFDKYRYSNMLSSPLTHIVNITGNASGLPVATVRQAVAGGIDAVKSAVTGAPRTRYAGEAVQYIKGIGKSWGDASKAASDVMTGKSAILHPDMRSDGLPLAVGGFKGFADKIMNSITRPLEAMDQLTMHLGTGGYKNALEYRASKGVAVKDIAEQAKGMAQYDAFRQELGKNGQGHVLGAIDAIPSAIIQWQGSKNPIIRNVAKFAVPFVTTPTNLFKQGIEYSPLGLTTLPGSADKTAQLAKSAMGMATVGVATSLLAQGDNITFSEPSNKEQRDAFRAEGKQPYAVNIGGKWIGYQKLHPAIAFNLALVGAVKQAEDEKTIDKSQAETLLNAGAKVLTFLTDQSYMKSVGDFTNSLQAKDASTLMSGVTSQVTNVANQLIPARALISWVGRMVDSTQRKVDTTAPALDQIVQGIIKDIPVLNKDVPTRTNPYTGEPLMNDNPILNAFSPARVTNDKGYGQTTGLNIEQRQIQAQMPAQDKQAFRTDVMTQKGLDNIDKKALDKAKSMEAKNTGGTITLPSGKVYAKVNDEYKSFKTQTEADKAVAKDSFTKSDKKLETFGDTVFYKTKDGTVKEEPKVRYDVSQAVADLDLEMDRTKRSDNVEGWFNAAQKKYDALEMKKQLYDPETEKDEIVKIINAQEDLLAQVEKFQGYGGFKKGGRSSSGGVGGGINASGFLSGAPQANASVRPTVSAKGGSTVKYQVRGKTAGAKPKVVSRRSLV